MRNAITREGRRIRRPPDDTVGEVALLDDVCGCETFVQRLLRFEPGQSAERRRPDDDEVLYVLAGEGELTVGTERVAVEEGTGVFVRHDTPWSAGCAAPLELLSVLVRDPEPAAAAHGVVDLAGESRRQATAARQFALGVRPEVGCASATQFLGFVPVGRAPDHFHRYDEVLYILAGSGVVHIDDERAPIGPGACVHLPARLVHCLENTGPGELRLLGVFRPAGSPAEAYYPDGTAAVPPEES